MKPDLVFICAHYMNQADLNRQVDQWKAYPLNVRARTHFILVDDASPNPPDLSLLDKSVLNLDVLQLQQDVGFNNGGARNTAVHHCALDSWMLLTDIDHIVPTETMVKILDAIAKRQVHPDCYYTFTRVGKRFVNRPHPNSFLIHRKTFLDVGGYDEDLSGPYGHDDTLFTALLKRRGFEQIHTKWEITHDANTEYDQASAEPDRKTASINLDKVRRKLSRPDYKPGRCVRVPYKRTWACRLSEES